MTKSEDDTVPNPWTPVAITQTARDFQEALGIEPTITRVSTYRWRIELANDRVAVTLDYTQTGSGRFRSHSSTLSVDGKRRETVMTVAELVQVFRNPDGDGPAVEVPTGKPDQLPATEPGDDMPSIVRRTYEQLAAAGGDLDFRAGRVGHRWVIGVDVAATETAASLALRFYFVSGQRGMPRRAGRGFSQTWRADKANPIQIFVDGVDRSAEVQGRLDKALALAFGPTPPGSGATQPPPISGTAPAARSNAVHVRKQTVIRV